MAQEPDSKIFCSFCGKTVEEVALMVVGPTVYICNECIDICAQAVAAALEGSLEKVTPRTQSEILEYYSMKKMGIVEVSEIVRAVVAASLCNATNGAMAWELLPSIHRTEWFNRADNIIRELTQREYMVVNIDEVVFKNQHTTTEHASQTLSAETVAAVSETNQRPSERLAALEAENERLRSALLFYSTPATWDLQKGFQHTVGELDGGRLARSALGLAP